jgi:hypothetical protein
MVGEYGVHSWRSEILQVGTVTAGPLCGSRLDWRVTGELPSTYSGVIPVISCNNKTHCQLLCSERRESGTAVEPISSWNTGAQRGHETPTFTKK